jgi:succinate dehydrogenase / fumarate reductase cytochrome b subunit
MAKSEVHETQTESASSFWNVFRWFVPAKFMQRGSGYYAWLLHRLTGLAILGYVFIHLWQLFYLTLGPDAYNEHAFDFTSPIYLFFDIILIALLAYHGFNGLRIIFFDMGWFVNDQKLLFLGVMILTAFFCVFAAYLIWFDVVPFIVKSTALGG